MSNINGTLMQYFEWYMESDQNLWNKTRREAEKLSELGITALWLPPAYKGIGGKEDVGYGAYDLYDLGEFDQKGSIKTKYGSKDEYVECIKALKQVGIESYADIVLNHKMGADMMQTIPATKVDWGDHYKEVSGQEIVRVATKFTFPGRKHKYSDFEWNWTHFHGIDYDDMTGECAIYKFKDKHWDDAVDEEFGNFDYLMGADIDFKNPEVVEECFRWAKWYLEETGVDGFRLDAVKHVSASFYRDYIKRIKAELKENLFCVGEYWSADISKLHRYIEKTEGNISLFDVALHYNLYWASQNDGFDLSRIFDNTLVKDNPRMAVTFVDNHDTQPSQSLESYINNWFKIPAYCLILLRNEGYPCVFYGDFYGIPHDNVEPMQKLDVLLKVRKNRAYGEQHDYLDHPQYIGWTREGDEEHSSSGLAVVISNAGDGEKRMYIGKKFIGKEFKDALENFEETVTIDEEGCGRFKVKGKSASVWILK